VGVDVSGAAGLIASAPDTDDIDLNELWIVILGIRVQVGVNSAEQR